MLSLYFSLLVRDTLTIAVTRKTIDVWLILEYFHFTLFCIFFFLLFHIVASVRWYGLRLCSFTIENRDKNRWQRNNREEREREKKVFGLQLSGVRWNSRHRSLTRASITSSTFHEARSWFRANSSVKCTLRYRDGRYVSMRRNVHCNDDNNNNSFRYNSCCCETAVCSCEFLPNGPKETGNFLCYNVAILSF